MPENSPDRLPAESSYPPDPQARVVLEGLRPQVNGGRFPVKRTVGQTVEVQVDLFADGHDRLAGDLLFGHEGDEDEWRRVPLMERPNDLWEASFTVEREGRYRYTAEGWVDRFRTWMTDTEIKALAGQDIDVELMVGSLLVKQASWRADGEDREDLQAWSETLADQDLDSGDRLRRIKEDDLDQLMARYPDRSTASTYPRELEVVVDRKRAGFGAWYEFFPRSCTNDPSEHGTFDSSLEHLEYVAEMGFDVVYLPPIHPIGETERKGPNNTSSSELGDPGSPWGIGGGAGGHTAVHPDLGTLEDFDRFLARTRELGMELALDLAFQCSPDHPWVREHPEWFRTRPDGSIQYAENPPKKYQDIYPLDFETRDWRSLWQALLEVVDFWVARGVRIFRVDNPHTKPFSFWEWLIGTVKEDNPDVLFLSEAFTRPKKMHRLAKLGFTQSYTYFTWRNTKEELSRFFAETFRREGREYFRPNFWPNTPDILNEYLQVGGRAAFMARLVLAATAAGSYGIYGPAFELCENQPREPGSEEYLDSEKYQIRVWDLEQPGSLRPFIRRLNRIRRENPALQQTFGFQLVEVENDKLLAYLKSTRDGSNLVLVVVNLDPHHVHSGWLHLPLEELGLEGEHAYQVHDLITDARYLWYGPRNFVSVDPASVPAHLFTLRRRVRTEKDFEYFV